MIEFILYALLHQPEVPVFPKINLVPFEQGETSYLPKKNPRKITEQIAPKLLENEQTSVLAIDNATGKKLLQKNAHRSQPIASLTKLMTALIILENHSLDEVVTVAPEAARVAGASLDLYAYEKITVKTLLEGMLIGSGNDAATALAIYHSDTEADFVTEMNARARAMKLFSAEFFNSTGLDQLHRKTGTVSGNKMSAHDVSKLARTVWQNEFVRKTVKQTKFSGTSIDGEFVHEKDNTNQLLGTFLDLQGLKTGYTQLAGQCFIAIGKTVAGNEVLTVILGSDDRFGESKKLLSWIYDSFVWE